VKVPVYNLTGEVVKNIKISDHVFGVAFNEAVVHQAMVRQQANARQGTSSTKTRGEVSGTTRKLYRQKHTGIPALLASYIGRNTPAWLGLAAAGRRYAGMEALLLDLSPGATTRQCPRRCGS